jgi:WhiB family redox-sensing transcriptional regulator
MTDINPSFIFDPAPWMRDAACKPHPTEWWFPERGDPTEQAKIICHTCPVRLDCLNYALNIPSLVGIWGGMSGKERRQIRSKPTKPIRHGTPTGYHQHLRRGTEPCLQCRQAHSRNTQLKKEQARERRLLNDHD